MADKIKSTTAQEITTFGSLGKEIKISPKSKVSINKPGFRKEFFVETAEVTIGIGKDHVAYLIMDVEAMAALRDGEKVLVTTLKEFKKNFL